MADGQRRRAGVLGSPIEHSKSPALHRAAYASLGLDWEYDRYEVDEGQLPGFMAAMDDSWAGLSLTMPLKEAVLPLLASVSDLGARLRSVNTVLPGSAPGTWHGENTDVQGIVTSVLQAHAGEPLDGGSAVILGGGATARSACAALPVLGITSVTVCARRPEAAQEVADLAAQFGRATSTASLEPAARLVSASLVISTLPGDAAAPWAELAGDGTGVLLDASYHPWPTPLASAWAGTGVASGRDMLLWQAVEQVRLMTGREPDAERMRAALAD